MTLEVLTMTVFNTGMTDLEKRKRYLMDLLAEKLKSSKISNYFLCKQQNYYSFFLDKARSSSFFRLSLFPVICKPENSKKERSFFFIFVHILFHSCF